MLQSWCKLLFFYVQSWVLEVLEIVIGLYYFYIVSNSKIIIKVIQIHISKVFLILNIHEILYKIENFTKRQVTFDRVFLLNLVRHEMHSSIKVSVRWIIKKAHLVQWIWHSLQKRLNITYIVKISKVLKQKFKNSDHTKQ